VITTGSGLIRYVIDDELEVVDFYQAIPCFRFLGRKMTVDLVGEKLDHSVAVKVLAEFRQEDYLPISILGIEHCNKKKPYYIMLSEGNIHKQPSAAALDQRLKENFHYELARSALCHPEHIDVFASLIFHAQQQTKLRQKQAYCITLANNDPRIGWMNNTSSHVIQAKHYFHSFKACPYTTFDRSKISYFEPGRI